MFQEFIPKSFLYLKSGYNFFKLKKDILAGLTVGIVALPLAMALGIASGVSPERGIVTAIIAGFLISALGGSRVQIGGPTAAFVVIIFHIIQRTGYEGLAVSTLLAGIILILFGIFKVGSWIKYVPHPLITGFTTGIALTIFSLQIKDFFGFDMGTPPAEFIDRLSAYWYALPSMDITTFLLGAGTLALILFIRRFIPAIPWGIVAIAASTLCVYIFKLDVETIQSKFGQIPNHLPLPSLPALTVLRTNFSEILMNAFAIAFLGGIESLLSAVIGDGMIGGRHKSNCELVGQGIANFVSVLFGGIPATGALARTATNVKTGAQTPVAGMIHALTLFLIVFFFAPIVSQIPLAALAAILFMVAWNMSEIHHFIHLLKAPMGDVVILVTTFLLTVFVDIVVAISLGMVLASFLFMKRMSEFSKTVPLKKILEEPSHSFPEVSDPNSIANKKLPTGVDVYEIQGPFFFGAADILKDLLVDLKKPSKVFILRMHNVPFVDASGMHALKEFYQKCHHNRTTLLLSGVYGQAEKDLKKFGIVRLVGEGHIFPHIDAALAKAEKLTGS